MSSMEQLIRTNLTLTFTGSDHAYTAGCSAMSVSSGCNTKNIAGIDTTICYCNSDMCNKAGKLEFSLLSFLVLLIAGAFGVMLT